MSYYCPIEFKACCCCGLGRFCAWYRTQWWCEPCWMICLFQVGLVSDDEESPRPQKSSDILDSDDEESTRTQKSTDTLDSDDDESPRTQKPSDTLDSGDKDTARKRELRAFITGSFVNEYTSIWGKSPRDLKNWLREFNDFVNDLDHVKRYLMDYSGHNYKVARFYASTHKYGRAIPFDKNKDSIDSVGEDSFTAFLSTNAFLQHAFEWTRFWTNRYEGAVPFDINKHPSGTWAGTPIQQSAKRSAETWAGTPKQQSAKRSAETWAGTFARTCASIFRIFSKDEKQMSLDLIKPLQDQAIVWVPPPPPDPPNPS